MFAKPKQNTNAFLVKPKGDYRSEKGYSAALLVLPLWNHSPDLPRLRTCSFGRDVWASAGFPEAAGSAAVVHVPLLEDSHMGVFTQ